MFFVGSGKVTSNSGETSISNLHALVSSRIATAFETFSLSHFSLVRSTTTDSSAAITGFWFFFRDDIFELSLTDNVGDGVFAGDAFDI